MNWEEEEEEDGKAAGAIDTLAHNPRLSQRFWLKVEPRYSKGFAGSCCLGGFSGFFFFSTAAKLTFGNYSKKYINSFS